MPRLKKKSQLQRLANNKKLKRKTQENLTSGPDLSDGPVGSQSPLLSVSERQKRYLLTDGGRQKHQERMTKYWSNIEVKKIHALREKERLDMGESVCQDTRIMASKYQLRKRICINNGIKDFKERLLHRVMERVRKNKRCMPSKHRLQQQQQNRVCQNKRLQDPKQRLLQQVRERVCQKKRLQDPKQRLLQQVRERVCQKKRFQDPNKRLLQQVRNRICQNKRLQDLKQRQLHRARERVCQIQRLKDPQKRKIHQGRESDSQRRRLEDPARRQEHLISVQQRQICREGEKRERHRISLYDKFNRLKREGPSYECNCCCRLWFKTSVKFFRVADLRCSIDLLKRTCKMVDENVVGYLCTTCRCSIEKYQCPKLSITSNNLHFPVINDAVKKLTDLEERFLAPRIPFMVIRATIGAQQLMVKGRAINVPIEVETSVNILPRVASETMVVPICFKRQRVQSKNTVFENVRPKIIEQAAISLRNSPLYTHCGINLELTRLAGISANMMINDQNQSAVVITESDPDVEADEEDDEEFSFNLADEATLLLAEAKVYAPGEGKKPISLFEEYVEAMSFIKIYGGELIKKPEGMSYQDWIKSEIMRSDRRCATVTKLFFSALKLRTSKISASINFCLRKAKSRTNIKAKNVLDPDYLKSIEHLDSGFKVLQADRGSPTFWEDRKKAVFAMIRQLGPPTIFLTMSPAENKWPELIVILKKVVDGENITEEEAANMEFREKTRLIRSDPVTLARYFDFRMRNLFNVLKQKNSIFREHYLVESYIRVEFQQRGSPHWHCLLWLHSTPKFSDEDPNNVALTEFIDRFISCSNDLPEDILQFQRHKHTFTCRKGQKKKKCRFDIPFFPLESTSILLPLKDVDKKEMLALRKQRQAVQEYLADAFKNRLTFGINDLLKHFKITYLRYISVIRCGLTRATVMLRRQPHECMINAYNPEILNLHCANMDIQFILDVYSCATYVLNYLNKSNRGLSKLMEDAVKEVRKGNYTIKEQLRIVGNQFLNASEFSAQEATYYILSLPLSKSTRSCVFINTSNPDTRTAVIKSKKMLEALPPDSNDIYVKTIHDHYANRPNDLEYVCFAEFTASYTVSSKKGVSKDIAGSDDEGNEFEDDENSSDTLKLRDGSLYLTKRRKPRIIRSVNFNEQTHWQDFVRENVMLYVPWRDESVMITSADTLFVSHQDVIKTNRSNFVFNEDIEQQLENAADQAAVLNESDEEEMQTPENLGVFGAFDQVGDIDVDMGGPTAKTTETNNDVGNQDILLPVPHMMSDEEYHNLICSLNAKQRTYILHVLHSFRSEQLPIYNCVMGGAGVGKSRLIQALNQTLVRHLNSLQSTDISSLKVLLCAPTGKAAFGIKGTTLHTAFILPLNQCSAELAPLSSSTKNTLFTKMKDLRLIIIDEISMVGARMIQQVDCRLKQVFKSAENFAGLSVITFGDFKQLPPVGDSYIFQAPPRDPYGDLVGNPLWRVFSSFTLTEVMRQKDDAPFAEALNNLACGKMTPEQVTIIKSREVVPEKVPLQALHLFPTNSEVDAFNRKIIDKDPERRIVFAIDKVSGKASNAMRQRLIDTAKSASTKNSQGLPFELALSIGIKYMITVNVDIEDGLVNGAVGTLKGYTSDTQGQVNRLWINFKDQSVGKKRRREVQHVDYPWTAIDKVKRNIRRQKGLVTIVREQFPLVPSEGITIYKSQGATYDCIAVHLSRKLRRSEVYVAMSRCTKLAGLHLIGKFVPPVPPTPTDRMQIEMKKLQAKPVRLSCLSPKHFPDDECIVYQNVQSLKQTTHWHDLNNYVQINQPALLIVGETWTRAEEDIEIPQYALVHRADVEGKKKYAYGLSIYVHVGRTFPVVYIYNETASSSRCSLVTGLFGDIAVCTGYKPPSTPYTAVEKQMEEMIIRAMKVSDKVIVLGDFNIDINQTSHRFFQMLLSKGLKGRLSNGIATTKLNTCIDIIFSNMDIYCGVTETFFGHHKQLMCIPSRTSAPLQEETNTNEFSDLSLTEAIQEGKWLRLRLQQTQRLEGVDMLIAKKLVAFVRESIPVTTITDSQVEIHPSLRSKFTPLKTTGDGNCFYYAVSLLLCGTENLMPCLRALEAAFILSNEDFLDSLPLYWGGIVSVDVLQEGTYAEIADVLLMSLLLRCPINIHTGFDTSSMRFAPFPNNKEIHLYLDLNRQHYSALLLKNPPAPLPPSTNIPNVDMLQDL